MPDVFYQSYASVMKRPRSDINLSTANIIVKMIEGDNDGLVTVDSARWGQRCILLKGNTVRGVSHFDEIDFRRSPLSGKDGEGIKDICSVYEDIVADLKRRGY